MTTNEETIKIEFRGGPAHEVAWELPLSQTPMDEWLPLGFPPRMDGYLLTWAGGGLVATWHTADPR